VDGICYDTEKADALCHTEEQDGLQMELYRDYKGRYFIVLYGTWGEAKPLISPCDKSHAMKLYEDHRRIEDEPTEAIFG
jgi:recombinational DNA repair protein RecR